MRREQLRKHRLPFFETGNFGINLLKIHGSLDEFAFNDGEDLLKLAPAEASVDGALTALGVLNREVRYVESRMARRRRTRSKRDHLRRHRRGDAVLAA